METNRLLFFCIPKPKTKLVTKYNSITNLSIISNQVEYLSLATLSLK